MNAVSYQLLQQIAEQSEVDIVPQPSQGQTSATSLSSSADVPPEEDFSDDNDDDDAVTVVESIEDDEQSLGDAEGEQDIPDDAESVNATASLSEQ